MINLIVLAVKNIAGKIEDNCFNNFLIEEKNIFTTIIINYMEKLRTFNRLEI